MFYFNFLLLFTCFLTCEGISLKKQLQHIAERRRESQGFLDVVPKRRYYDFHPGKSATILGAPSFASHLPRAEPILPGHTLLRPSLDMLRSAIEFPHKDLDNGAGVYGNLDNLGIAYGSTKERVLYTGYRRNDDSDSRPIDYYYNLPRSSLRQGENTDTEDQDEENKINIRHHTLTKDPSALILVPLDSSGEATHGIDHREGLGKFDSFVYPKRDQEPPKENHEIDKKSTWFWNSKDAFNHIVINQDAPELKELLPGLNNQKNTEWWFFHQNDHQPFESD